MKKQMISFQGDAKLKKKIDDFAKEQDVSSSEVVRTAVEFYLGFDPYFRHLIRGYSQRHKLPPHLVIQNMLIRRWAYEAAEDDVYGPQQRLLPEFTHTAEGFLTGGELFEFLKDHYYNRFGQEQIQRSREAHAQSLKQHDRDMKF